MTSRHPADLPASVHRRLLNISAKTGEDPNALFARFARERFLYRLSVSEQRRRFVLKGATLFAVWEHTPHRATRDIDLLGLRTGEQHLLREAFSEICAAAVEPDGLVFDDATMRFSTIREREAYAGTRVKMIASLSKAQLPVQVDVGFGDAVTPAPEQVTLETILDFPAPVLRAYPMPTVIAEKVHAMVSLVFRTSRMKDLLDISVLAERFDMDGATLVRAIRATAMRRATVLPETLPAALTQGFADEPEKQIQWNGFVSRNRLEAGSLGEVVAALRRFLAEPYLAATRGEPFIEHWRAGGPWS